MSHLCPTVLPLSPQMFQFGENSYMERAGEMVQWVRVVIGFTEDLNSLSSTCVDVFITTYNSSSKGSNALLWHLQALYSHTQNMLFIRNL